MASKNLPSFTFSWWSRLHFLHNYVFLPCPLAQVDVEGIIYFRKRYRRLATPNVENTHLQCFVCILYIVLHSPMVSKNLSPFTFSSKCRQLTYPFLTNATSVHENIPTDFSCAAMPHHVSVVRMVSKHDNPSVIHHQRPIVSSLVRTRFFPLRGLGRCNYIRVGRVGGCGAEDAF